MNQKEIGKFIASLRKEKQLTQEQFAEILGVNNRTVSRWENGHNMPDLSLLPIISEQLEVDIAELISGRRRSIEEMAELRDSINVILNKSEEEKEMKTRKMNIHLIAGLTCLVLAILQSKFGIFSLIFKEHIDEFLHGAITGLALVFMIVGLYNNNHEKNVKQQKKEFLKG